MPKRSKAPKSIESTAFKKEKIKETSGVEEMYTIYTYRYINDSNSIYLFWEISNLQRTDEIEHVLSYYKQMCILESYSCDQVNLSCEAIQDLLIIAGHRNSIVSSTEYNFVKPIIQNAIIGNSRAPLFFTKSDTLAYVSFFDRIWYIPFLETTELVCKPVPTHLPSSALFSWYENELLNSSKKDADVNQTDRYAECKVIWDRCAALISKETNQKINIETVLPMKNEVILPEAIPSKKETDQSSDSSIVINKEVIDLNDNEVIDLYLQIYLEPSTQKDVLLSEVYLNYKERLTKYGIAIATQAYFIKQLRSHDKFKITRHSRGMVITNYKIVTDATFIHYMDYQDAFTASHYKIIRQFKSKFPSNPLPYAREAFWLLSNAMNIEPTYYSILLYLSDPKTEAVINAYKSYIAYLDDMPEWNDSSMANASCYDTNDTRKVFETRTKLVESITGITYYFPFSKEIVKKNHIISTQTNNIIGVFINSMTNGVPESSYCEYGHNLIDVNEDPCNMYIPYTPYNTNNVQGIETSKPRYEQSYKYDETSKKWICTDSELKERIRIVGNTVNKTHTFPLPLGDDWRRVD